jgi:hypothetical protein
MKIFGWAADDAGPAWYRLRVPLAELSKHGYQTSVDTRMPPWVLEEADVVIGQRVCQPGATKRWRRLAAGVYGHRPLLVFDIDDNMWDIDPSNLPAWTFYGGDPDLLDNLTECARLADVCTVSTPALAEVVGRINPNVMIVPNQLPSSAFGMGRGAPHGGNPFRVGWAGGGSHQADIPEATPGLGTFFSRHSDPVFHVIGTAYGSLIKAVGLSRFQRTKWIPRVLDYYEALDFHVGLAPLRPSVFNQSKSEIKFLEYSARGIATIASPVGPYEWTIVPEDNGLLAARPHEWCSRLTELYHDEAMRADIVHRAQYFARQRTIEKNWQSWAAVFRNEPATIPG